MLRRGLAIRDTYPDSLLKIASTADAERVTLSLSGAIDIHSAPDLDSALLDAERALAREIVLDLGALEFIDSTGIHLLINAQQRADAAGHALVLTHPPAHAVRLFALTGIDARLTSRG